MVRDRGFCRDIEEDVRVVLCGIAVQNRDGTAFRQEGRTGSPLKIGVLKRFYLGGGGRPI